MALNNVSDDPWKTELASDGVAAVEVAGGAGDAAGEALAGPLASSGRQAVIKKRRTTTTSASEPNDCLLSCGRWKAEFIILKLVRDNFECKHF